MIRRTLIWVMRPYYVQLDFDSPSLTFTSKDGENSSSWLVTNNRQSEDLKSSHHAETPSETSPCICCVAVMPPHGRVDLDFCSSYFHQALSVFTVLFRRHVFDHLPFAIASAPKYVERRVSQAGERFQYMLCVVS